MAWNINVTKNAATQIKKLGPIAERQIYNYLRTRIAPLHDPRQLGKQLRVPTPNLWRYRIGDYRIICQIKDEEMLLLVVKVGHRRSVYRRP